MDAQKSEGQESKSPKTGVERNRRRDAERKAEGQTADGSSKVITMVQSKNLGKCGRKEERGKREDEKVGSEKEGKEGRKEQTCARGSAHESRSESPDNHHQASKFNWYSLREF